MFYSKISRLSRAKYCSPVEISKGFVEIPFTRGADRSAKRTVRLGFITGACDLVPMAGAKGWTVGFMRFAPAVSDTDQAEGRALNTNSQSTFARRRAQFLYWLQFRHRRGPTGHGNFAPDQPQLTVR